MIETDPRDIIGQQDESDFELDTRRHLDRYRESAPELSRLIGDEFVAAHALTYRRYDEEAKLSRRDYFRWMRRTNVGVFLTSVSSATAMAWSLWFAGQPGSPLAEGAQVFSILAVVGAALGSVGLYILREGKLLETWMRKRAMAETHRIDYFETVLKRAVEDGGRTVALALEYFRRYQFEVQRNYYHYRARQHENSARRTLWIGAAGALLAAVSTSTGVFLDDNWRWLGAVSVLGAALGAFAIGREQMTQDRRNAERYDRTYSALLAQAGMLKQIRSAVGQGRDDVVLTFAAAVNEQVSNEHRQWLEQADAAKRAIQEIERTLGPGRLGNADG